MNLDNTVLDFLKVNGKMCRNDISNQLGVARSTIYDSLCRLIVDELIMKEKIGNGLKGRSKVYYSVLLKDLVTL